MDETILMNFIAPLLLGLAIGYLLWRTRRPDWHQRQQTENKTEQLYDETEKMNTAVEAEDAERKRKRA